MNKIVILHFWHSLHQADEYIHMNQQGGYVWPVCRFRGKPFTTCSPQPTKPLTHPDFRLVGVGTEGDIQVGPELW